MTLNLNRPFRRPVLPSLLLCLVAGPSIAQSQNVPSSPLMQSLLACRSIDQPEPRLACFDQASAAFETAQRDGEIAVVDQAQARQARSRLFGLDLDGADIFGGLRASVPVEAIETRLARASQDGRGQWTFVLEDGSTWRQIDTQRLSARAAPGATVQIRQAAMGSYLLSVNDSRSVRARRER